jgi:hypothetical protein
MKNIESDFMYTVHSNYAYCIGLYNSFFLSFLSFFLPTFESEN